MIIQPIQGSSGPPGPPGPSTLQDTILTSRIVSGNADYFSLPGGLVLRLEASTADPFVYDIGGTEISLTASVDLTVTNNAHNFVFLDSSGALHREARPTLYSYSPPSSPAAGQTWYNLGKRRLERWNGSAWVAVPWVAVGYVRADGGSINPRYACEPLRLTPDRRVALYGDGSSGFLDNTVNLDGVTQATAVILRAGTTLFVSGTGADNVGRRRLKYCQGPFVILEGTTFANQVGGGFVSGSTGDGVAGNVAGVSAAGGGGAGLTGNGGNAANRQRPNATATSSPGGTAPGGNGANGTLPHEIDLGELPYPTTRFGGARGGGGGGNGFSAGGNSGSNVGCLLLHAAVFAIDATSAIRSEPTPGVAASGPGVGGGGGCGGGYILLEFGQLFNDGTISVAGSVGGASGGANSGKGGDGATGTLVLRRRV